MRFTPLPDTNDTFEVRSTFDKLVGPKMLSMLAEQMDNTLSEESVRKPIADMLKENGSGWLPPELALQFAQQQYGGNFTGLLRAQMQQAVDAMPVPYVNDPENAKKLFEKLGRDLLGFSFPSGWIARPCGHTRPTTTQVS